MSQSKPAKRRYYDIDTYTDNDNSPSLTPSSDTLLRHTTYLPSKCGLAASRSYVAVPASPTKCAPPIEVPASDTLWNTVPGGDLGTMNHLFEEGTGFVESEVMPSDWMDPNLVETESLKRKRSAATETPLLIWMPEIDRYLHELLRHDGRGGTTLLQDICAWCECPSTRLYRCSDCFNACLECATCMVFTHAEHPLHRLKEWHNNFFATVTLKSLGLRIQLGHLPGELCSNPKPAFNDDFVILDISGVHGINLDFCDCQTALNHDTQLLRMKLFPATTIDPKTAATFQVLEFFQLLSFMSKVTAFDFYHTLARRMDNTGLTKIHDRYLSFLRMVRQWRHLKMIKRMGRGHDPSGVKGTKEGELAVLCPACPHPGKNLPPGWNTAPPFIRWLYVLFVGMDANFRLKRADISSNDRDPGLNRGYAYFVHDPTFKTFLEEYGDLDIPEDDTAGCSNYDAVKSANIRGGKGIDASGVGKLECTRHDMKRPVSVGDLQKGERFVNMDFFLLSGISQNPPLEILLTYDIVCIYICNLALRCGLYPANIFAYLKWRYAVPKFHLPAHRSQCQVKWSLNYTPLVGRTDGEAPERGWAAMNAVANSTKQMGPGSRRDTLDDHFGDYNWRKVTTLAGTLLKKLKEAISERTEHVKNFREFSAAIPLEDTKAWTFQVQAWEKDTTESNPFEETLRHVSEHAIRLEMAQEDDATLLDEFSKVHDDIPPSRLIAQGIELEEHQRQLCIDKNALGPHSTDLQNAKVLERSNRLWRKIEAWTNVQQLYIPGVARLRMREEAKGGAEAVSSTNIDLLLPSKLFGHANCDPLFFEYEWRLRYGQAHDILHALRGQLLLRTQMYKSKRRHIRGQHMLTRSGSLINSVNLKIKALVFKYHSTREALVTLSVPLAKTGWENEIRPLIEEDVRGLAADENDGSEGHRTMSWIWKTTLGGPVGSDGVGHEQKHEALRIEWCKARARAHRWQEECLLLEEEMRRVKAFFVWQEGWWMERAATGSSHADPAVSEGLNGYAHYQAQIRADMRSLCEEMWADVPEMLKQGEGTPKGEVFLVECH